jgi:hypothetical protein
MRYTDHLRRTINRLNSDEWERLLVAAPDSPPAPKTVLVLCPCCRLTVAVDLVATVHSVATEPPALPDVAADTQIELDALTHADLLV